MSSKQLICELFGLSKEETIFEDFGCALQQTILLHGRLFISERHICFYANIMGLKTKQVIPFSDVIEIEKKAVFGFIPNAIEIKTSVKTYYFCSFSKRNAAYQLLYSLWKEEPFSQDVEQFDEDVNDIPDVQSQVEVSLSSPLETEINFLQTDSKDSQKELLKVILPIKVDQFFDLLFADEAKFSLLEHYKLKKEREIVLSKWIENPEMGTYTRELKMVIWVKENPLKDHSRCYKVQSYKRDQNGKLIINSNTKNLDIPYGSCFQVEEQWEISNVEGADNKCMLRCLVWVVFNKSTLFKSFIENKVMEGVKKDYEIYINNIRELKILDLKIKKSNNEGEFEQSKAMELKAQEGKPEGNKKNKGKIAKKNERNKQFEEIKEEIIKLKNEWKTSIQIFLGILLIFLIIIIFLIWNVKGLKMAIENMECKNFQERLILEYQPLVLCKSLKNKNYYDVFIKNNKNNSVFKDSLSMTMNYFNENIEKFEINSDFRIKELSKIIIEDKFNDFPFVIFTKRCSSTQKLLLNNFEDFEENLIFITDEQDDGIGRKLNKWDSPIGCLMSSILLNIDNKILNISKFIVALALIKTIKSFDKLDARIKWPNDIYYNKNKLGGIICNSYSNILNTKLITGFGININNNYPTICLNQILTEKIDSYNFYAVFLQKFIFLISQYLINESDIINEINNFLICEEEVNFYSDKNEKKLKKIKIIGIDQNGNLKALNINKLEEITISANFYTYDIINNLIKPI